MSTGNNNNRKQFTDEEKKKMREAKRAFIVSLISKVKSLTDNQKSKILKGFHPERIDNTPLSERNTLLISVQAVERGLKPSVLGGYKQWNEVNRRVKQGEKGILIIVPVKQENKPEPFFAGKYVFDESQTEEMSETENSQAVAESETVGCDTVTDDLPF